MATPFGDLGYEGILENLAELEEAARKQEVVIAKLNERVLAQETLLIQKDQHIAELETQLAKAKKTSRNSSKPPSSDIVKPKKKGKGGKRKIGGQKGHPLHVREPFGDEDIQVTEHTLDACPDCDGELEAADTAPRVIQQIEIKETPVQIDEHRGVAYWCARCEKIHYAPLPKEVTKGGLIGPELTARIAYLKGVCHLSYASIVRYVDDLLGIPGKPFSTGLFVKVIQRASESLTAPYQDLEAQLALENLLNIDETGHKENGDRLWTWCFRAELFTFFHIAETRGSQVLFDLLGEEFSGVIGSDLFSAYRKFMKESHAVVQFCMAHLIRDVRFLTTLSDAATRRYGERLLEGLRALFRVIHRRDELTEKGFVRRLQEERGRLIALAKRAPGSREAQNMAKRFREYGEAYFTFITTPGLEPTNNLAEQAIRFVVIDRLITQGTRSERGRQWCERIWTTIATCAQQGRSAYAFLRDAIRAHFTGQPAPSLLPNNG